jgi:hypothetical protein
MAYVAVKDRPGATVARLPRNTDDVKTHLTAAQANTLKSDIDSSGYFPADGGKYPLPYSYPAGDYTSALPMADGYTTAVVPGDSWD